MLLDDGMQNGLQMGCFWRDFGHYDRINRHRNGRWMVLTLNFIVEPFLPLPGSMCQPRWSGKVIRMLFQPKNLFQLHFTSTEFRKLVSFHRQMTDASETSRDEDST